MSALVLFDSRFATSIASAAIVKSKVPGTEAIDTAETLTKKQADKRKAQVKNAKVVYVMVDDSPYATGKKAEVYYVKKEKKDEARRVLGLWNELTGGAKVPLVIHYLGGVRLSEDQKTARTYVKNAIPSYLRDLEGAAMHAWNRLLREPQDVALLNQYVANGQIIEDYLSQFGDQKTDKVSAKDLKAAEAKVASLKDQEEEIEKLEAELEEVTDEMELRGKSIENYYKDKGKLISKVEKSEADLEKEKEAHAKTKLNLENSLSDASSTKEAIASKTKEIEIVRQDLEKTEPILKKEKAAHESTQNSLVAVREELAVEIKKGKESRTDYEKEVKAVVKLEGEVKKLTTAAAKQEKDSANAAKKAADKITALNAEIKKLKK